MAFKYRARDASTWEKRAAGSNDWEGIFDSAYKEYSVRKGDNYIRILPPTWDNAEHYGLDVYVHYSIGPDRATVLCPFKMSEMARALGKPEFAQGKCPICEARAKLERAGDKEGADELRYTKRVAVWIVDLKEEEAGPQIWAMPSSLDVNICKLARDPRTGETFVLDHPDQGYGISFEKEGEGLKTKYVALRLDHRPSSVNGDFLDFIEATPLTEQLVWRTYEQIQHLYAGGQPADAASAASSRDRPHSASTRAEAEGRTESPREGLRERGSSRGSTEETSRRAAADDESLRRDEEALHARTKERSRPEDPPFDGGKPAAEAPSGRSRAEELRARFARK